METISSPANPKIKELKRLLDKKNARQTQQVIAFEGARELQLAQQAHCRIEQVFICRELFAGSRYPHALDGIEDKAVIEVTRQVFSKLAYRENSDGIITVAKPQGLALADLPLSPNPFIIVLESVEKPGNLGAVLRTADAARADAVIVCNPLCDCYNPNVIRSSVGCIFTVPLAVATPEDTCKWLKTSNITSYATALTATDYYHRTDFTKPAAIILGTEADGLSPFWLQNATKQIKIPMRGAIDSLNVSVSAAVVAFEAMRQRNFT
jgi:TrmH family RNA methyltransferase